MATTMYLRNRDEVAAAARTLRDSGYETSIRDLMEHDRYVSNIISRFVGMDTHEQGRIESAIVNAVESVRRERRRD